MEATSPLARPDGLEVMSRDDAHRLGLARYYTGQICKRGHLCERFVSNGGCVQCMNYKRIPAIQAPNVLMPPSGYAIPGDYEPSPRLARAIHAHVLAHMVEIINACEVASGIEVVYARRFRLTDKAQGATRLQLLAAGWNDTTLVAAGLMVRG